MSWRWVCACVSVPLRHDDSYTDGILRRDFRVKISIACASENDEFFVRIGCRFLAEFFHSFRIVFEFSRNKFEFRLTFSKNVFVRMRSSTNTKKWTDPQLNLRAPLNAAIFYGPVNFLVSNSHSLTWRMNWEHISPPFIWIWIEIGARLWTIHSIWMHVFVFDISGRLNTKSSNIFTSFCCVDFIRIKNIVNKEKNKKRFWIIRLFWKLFDKMFESIDGFLEIAILFEEAEPNTGFHGCFMLFVEENCWWYAHNANILSQPFGESKIF